MGVFRMNKGEEEVRKACENCTRCGGTGTDPEHGEPQNGPDACHACADRWREYRIDMEPSGFRE